MPDARDLPVPGPHAGSDRALSETDRTGSERDQARADADQLASDRDQAISDRHLANGGDPVAHAFSRDIRRRATHEREQTKRGRLLAAAHRDEIARIRDLTARIRDRATGRPDAPSARALH